LFIILSQDRERKVSKFEKSGLTEEELLRQQEELFAASRAKFQNNQ
jgi:down-regulator of transcription 1